MPTYKLTYFNARGRAEVVRLMFAAAGVEYEDKRITREEWASLKSSTPMGVLPLFEVDGKVLGQSTTIWRYVAFELGFAGRSHWEAAKIDEMVETLMELAECVKQLIFIAKTEEEKATALNKLKDEKLPQILKFVEHMLKENGNNGWMVGNKLSLADIATFHMVSQVCNLLKSRGFQGFCADFPNARQHIHKIRDIPEIKHWVETRPQTDM